MKRRGLGLINRLGTGLLLVNLLTWLLVIVISFVPSSVVRIIIGVPVVLFFPGYALVLALFPRKEGLNGIERVGLGFGLSIGVVPLIGLVLNYAPWGIRLESMLYSITFFIFVMSIITWLRQRRLPKGERFSIQFTLGRPMLCRGGALDKVLSIVLVLAILGALATLGYVIARPKVGEKFTEFYVLGPGGGAQNYPKELKLGEKGTVIVGVINHEYETVTYRVEVRIGGVTSEEAASFTLKSEEESEFSVEFVPQTVGQNQEVEFLLYKNGELDPDIKPLHLWIDVVE
jgi:uncharacterized membrane protein